MAKMDLKTWFPAPIYPESGPRTEFKMSEVRTPYQYTVLHTNLDRSG